MKNNMVFMLFFSTLFAQGMEKENTWSITAYGTKITLHKGDILDYYADENKKTDIVIVVGQYKQEELGETPVGGNLPGKCWQQQTVRFTPKEDSINYQKARTCVWDFPQRENIQFLVVTEPRVFNQPGEDSKYWFNDSECYTKEVAITESCKSLLHCYNAVLNAGIELQKEKSIKNIALPMLGADSQYEHARMFKKDVISIAVNSFIKLLKHKRDAYNNIEFFVENYSDVDLCKQLLLDFLGFIEKFSLVLLAHKESGSIVALLPNELISHIALLYNTVHCT